MWASGVSESRHEGAADRTTWTPVVGLADETSERGGLCGISPVRSSRRQPSTTECPGGDDLPQGGGPHRSAVWKNRRERELWRVLTGRKHRTNGGSKLSGRKSTQALTLYKRSPSNPFSG